jgi:pyruvate/2-oxoglutarate dehydrogenase complex dihydrolipoamide dehydrogenase (E3) component
MMMICDDIGVRLYFNAIVCKVSIVSGEHDPVTGSGLYAAPWITYAVEVEVNGVRETIHCDAILNATGRAPNVHNLGLEAVHVDYDNRRGIYVNDYLQTTNNNIYSCGDCSSAFKFTHVADFQARIAVRNMFLGGNVHRNSDLLVPWCTYTDPEIAHVGKYEEELQRQQVEYEILTRQLKDVDRCICDGIEEGFVKLIIRAGSQQILGATICGPHAGDMISELTVCMQYGITVPQIAGTIHPYPTSQEAIRQACLGFNKYYKNPEGAALKTLKLFMIEKEQEAAAEKKSAENTI